MLTGDVSSWPVESQEHCGFLFFVGGGGQLSSMYFGRMDDKRISGISYCGRSDCYRFVGAYCDMSLRFPERLPLCVYCDDQLRVAFRAYLSVTQGQSAGTGRISLEVSVFGSSFSRVSADAQGVDARES